MRIETKKSESNGCVSIVSVPPLIKPRIVDHQHVKHTTRNIILFSTYKINIKGIRNLRHRLSNPTLLMRQALNHHVTQDKYQVILSTAIVEVFDQHGNPHTCRVLLDSGLQSNFVTEKLAQKLDIVRKQVNLSITGINKSQTHSCHVINIRIRSIHTSFSQRVECYVLNSITENLSQIHINTSNFQIPHIKLPT